ncbi:PREDICTED: probable LRR receptor-like serine/threonine-protein kinase At4g36180 [Prunus mume]|uniref:Probable LRR receptor-like serine/threonine-protein kinase At4g36180 n=1 Tax=Prunus mume TaxID=102107 RepID=A0ABM1LYD0_PRUMU|nr:PREDICTED: probable LRR receptor-like serine/threonine-protein kinase At4g36180 [Prunus mume]
MTVANMVEARCCFKLLYAIVVVLLLHMSSPCIGCSERDRQALLALKQGLVGDDGDRLLSWGREAQNKNCCQWEGVYCSSNQTGHVVKLDLEDQSLRGKISPELVKLQHLEYLDLSFNDFGWSKIPDFIGSLSNLIYLDLSYANFGGQIPNQLGNLTHLQYLDLSSISSFDIGPLPVNSIHAKNLNWLPNLSGLIHLDLSYTDLSDVVGWLEAVNMLPKLTNLILYYCKLPPPIISSVSLLNSSKSLVHVDLGVNNLNPSIFQWLSGTHTNLVYLDLLENNFIGSSIPVAFGNMSSLAYLSLYDNQLEGGIPNSFAKLCRLRVLDLGVNSLSGQLSDFVETLSKCAQKTLESLCLEFNNNISGSLPDLTNFVSLKDLILQDNNLSGRIPESIGQMSKLETIRLGGNSLEGMISETHFSKLSKLSDLSLSSLRLNFSFDWIPPFQLQRIQLASCKMWPSSFPKWLQTQKNYTWLDISDAGISDTIPSWFWDLSQKLEIMDISHNQLRGTVGNIRLEFAPELNLSWNQLEGPIPSILSKASILDLSHNNFSGAASFLCATKDSNLTFLDLSSNHISGQLPDCWINLKKLVFLDLSNNNLFGKIPTTMGYLFSIETLRLSNNRFVGELPSQLKNCRNLTLFDLGENNLSCSIPEWLGASLPNLGILILRGNQFYRSIPPQLCHLTRIQILDLSINNISGTIPKCLNNLIVLAHKGNSSQIIQHSYTAQLDVGYIMNYEEEASLTWKGVRSKYKSTLGLVKSIDLSSNKLTGEIPSEITDLVGLVSLNLSRNQLTGQIPPRIGMLQELDSLDLSRNQINGRIPNNLSQIDRIGYLDLSENNLSGKIPIGTQLQSFDPSSYGGNPLLCGLPLLRTCHEEEKGPGQTVLVNQDDKDGLLSQGFYISLGLGFAVGFWGVFGTLLFNKSCRYTYFNFWTCFTDWLYVKAEIIRQRMPNTR